MKQVRGMEVAGVTARKGGPALAKLANKMGFDKPIVYKGISEMAKHVDCIAVFCPNFARIPVVEEIVASVKAGAHLKGVICEKPLGRTVAEARRLVDLAAAANLPTAYFENQLFMKAIRAQRLQLEPVQKAMGPLSLTRCAEEHAGPHEPWF
jgi:predicted dehydrogenase